jgi:hypothetical protein
MDDLPVIKYQEDAAGPMRAALSATISIGDEPGLEPADISIQSNAPPQEAAENGFRRINSGID